MAYTFALLAILTINGKYICIPYLRALQSCTIVSKTAAREQRLKTMSRNHLLSGNHLPSLKQMIKSRRELDRTR